MAFGWETKRCGTMQQLTSDLASNRDCSPHLRERYFARGTGTKNRVQDFSQRPMPSETPKVLSVGVH
jgi:hypothetical protein